MREPRSDPQPDKERWIPETLASDPLGLRVSPERLGRVCPFLFGDVGLWLRVLRAFMTLGGLTRRDILTEVEGQLAGGDTRAALLIHLDPVTVSLYSDELDAVVFVEYPKAVLAGRRWRAGQRLLAVFTYRESKTVAKDLAPGPGDSGTYVNLAPMIAEFFSDDEDLIEARKERIAEAEWLRCELLTIEYHRKFGRWCREGSPVTYLNPGMRFGNPAKICPWVEQAEKRRRREAKEAPAEADRTGSKRPRPASRKGEERRGPQAGTKGRRRKEAGPSSSRAREPGRAGGHGAGHEPPTPEGPGRLGDDGPSAKLPPPSQWSKGLREEPGEV